MSDFLSGNTLLTMAVLIFVSMLLLLEGLYLFWQGKRGPQARQLQRRLRALSETDGDARQSRLLKHRSRRVGFLRGSPARGQQRANEREGPPGSHHAAPVLRGAVSFRNSAITKPRTRPLIVKVKTAGNP